MNKRLGAACLATLFCWQGAALVADPPSRINVQGVLRDSFGQPANGDHDVELRLFDDPVAGNELLIDRHLLSGTGAVTVNQGLFSVPLGGGDVSDGSGPGTFTTVAEVFRNQMDVWVEIKIQTA